MLLRDEERFVGISSKPISKKIWRNSWRTFMRGWKAPAGVRAPFDLKLYGFNWTVFHAPLASISAVRSVSSFTNSLAYFGPFVTSKEMTFCRFMSFLFLRSASVLGSAVFVRWMVWSCSREVSIMESVCPN